LSTRVYPVTVGGGRSTEELVAAGEYGYAHAAITSENFPADRSTPPRLRGIVLLQFDHAVSFEDVVAEARQHGLERPTYEDALHFGITHPEAQRERPIIFLHEPWLGVFGRRDVVCLWSNAGRRELGLEGFDESWGPEYRFAFVTGS
jgi:hypothetical protein